MTSSDHNSTIKCILIDDEKENLDLMEYMLLNSGHKIQIQEKLNDPILAIDVLANTNTDLVFLDIQMPNCSGFDVLNKLTSWDFHLVFATAYDQFAIQALRLGAFDYLLKPINQDALNKLLNRLVKKINYEDQKLNNFVFEKFSSIQKIKSRKKLLPGAQDLINVDLDNVLYFEADGIFSWAFLKNGVKLFISLQLKQLEDDLQFIDYFRIHKSYLINLNEVVKVSRKDGITVVMSDDKEIPVSRLKKAEFFEKVQNL